MLRYYRSIGATVYLHHLRPFVRSTPSKFVLRLYRLPSILVWAFATWEASMYVLDRRVEVSSPSAAAAVSVVAVSRDSCLHFLTRRRYKRTVALGNWRPGFMQGIGSVGLVLCTFSRGSERTSSLIHARDGFSVSRQRNAGKV